MECINLEMIKNNPDEYLFCDLKKCFELNEERYKRIEESTYEALSYKSDEIIKIYQEITGKTIDDLKYDADSKSDTVNIENFLRYKICNVFGLNFYKVPDFDIDKTDVVVSWLIECLKNNIEKCLDNNEKYSLVYEKCTLIIENCELENRVVAVKLDTDTMNSYATTFLSFCNLIMSYSDKKEWQDFIGLSMQYDIKDWQRRKLKTSLKYTFLLDYISKFKDDKYIETIKLFNEFASLTHTIGNFIWVPAGFNGPRGIDENIEDYWDRTIEYLNNLVDGKVEYLPKFYLENKDSYQWYVDNYQLFNMEMFFKELSDTNRIQKDFSKYEQFDFDEYLKTVNELIKLRGKSMLKTMNKK